jgi:polysaccharide export outer membrane protein
MARPARRSRTGSAAVVLLLAFLIAAAAPSSPRGEPYTLSPGDSLVITVWGEESLKRELVVLPDGAISYPFAGRLEVTGMTTDEVETLIKARLAQYVPDAAVAVSVVNSTGYRIYVTGAVNKAGEYQVPRRITVMQAISLAGGLTPFASEDSIVVLRDDGKKQTSIDFPYAEVKRGRELNKNIELKSGDTVVVSGRSLF